MSIREFNSFKEGKDLSIKSLTHNKSMKAGRTNNNHSKGLTMHGDMRSVEQILKWFLFFLLSPSLHLSFFLTLSICLTLPLSLSLSFSLSLSLSLSPTHTHTLSNTPSIYSSSSSSSFFLFFYVCFLFYLRRKGFQPQCMAFEQQNGEIIAIGFRNGEIKILNTETLQDISSFTPSSDSILFLKFSSSGSYFAGYDAGNHTLLFKRYGLYCTVLYYFLL